MMQNIANKYYACHVRWQQRNGFLLWLDCPEPEREALWADAQNKVPLFETYQQLSSFVISLDEQLESQEPQPTNLDAVAAWAAGSAERPVEECLRAWGVFDDLSVGIQKQFAGNQRNSKRNRIFDKLCAESGPYIDSGIEVPWRMDDRIQWQQVELDTLRRILTQGLLLWQQNTYWQQEA